MSTSTVKIIKRGPGRPRKSEYDANGNLKPKIVSVKAIPEVKKDKLTLPIITVSGTYLQMSTKHEGAPNYYRLNCGQYYIGPTNNCQLASVASFNNTVDNVSSTEALVHVLKCFSQRAAKRIILVDLNSRQADKLRKLLKDTNMIIVDSPYKSTNGSHMTIFLIKVWGVIDYSYMANMKKIQDKQV